MKSYTAIPFIAAAIVMGALSCTSGNKTYYTPDTTTVLRNPLNGWVMYLRRDWDENFWESFGYDSMETSEGGTVKVSDYANTAYVRTSWAAFEPEEGKYAWNDPESRLNKLFKSILDRGMKLSFRIVVDGRDQRQNTPDYVFDAGAEYFTSKVGKNTVRSPYPDDPVFQEKYSRFIEALAREYNDIDKVDFIDAYGLGKWGEGHSLIYKDPTKNSEVMAWITGLYARTFTEIPLVINYHRLLGEPSKDGWGPVSKVSEGLIEQAIGNGYSLRHDAFGMTGYYQDWEKEFAAKWNYKRPIIFEGGWITAAHHRYWVDPSGEYREGHSEDVRKGEFKAAAEAHVNMMDLRVNDEVRSWFGKEFDLVKRFISEGGYRLYPVWVKAPSKASGSLSVEYEWQNMGWGYCPVNIPQWNWRYTVGFALLDSDGIPVKKWASEKTDLSAWLKGSSYDYADTFSLEGVAPGEYTLATALVDRKKELEPGLDAAVEPSAKCGKWIVVRKISVK